MIHIVSMWTCRDPLDTLCLIPVIPGGVVDE